MAFTRKKHRIFCLLPFFLKRPARFRLCITDSFRYYVLFIGAWWASKSSSIFNIPFL